MLIDFFFTLKDARIPVSIKEFLILLEAMQKNVIGNSLATSVVAKWEGELKAEHELGPDDIVPSDAVPGDAVPAH